MAASASDAERRDVAEAQAARQPDDRRRMALTVSDICLLFARKGGRLYEGEPVTQLEHALQSAARAEAARRHRPRSSVPRCCTISATC